MKFLDTEALFTQGNILVHFVKVLVHRVDQIVINTRRNIICINRTLQRGSVFSCFCVKYLLLYITAVKGMRGPIEAPAKKKKGFMAKLKEKAGK